ncbi:MAG: hypothetical protein ABIU77_17065 [Ferruginibacter sp.]
MNKGHPKSRELTSKRLRARHLIVVKGYNQKETAKIVGVSNKTICAWNEKYDWGDAETTAIKRKGGLSVVMKDFYDYVRSSSPELLKPIMSLWNGFLKAQEKDFG